MKYVVKTIRIRFLLYKAHSKTHAMTQLAPKLASMLGERIRGIHFSAENTSSQHGTELVRITSH